MTAIAAAIATVVIAGVQMGYSIDQANKAKDAQAKAEAAAERKMSEAMKRLDVNYMESLAIPMEAYEQQAEQMLQVSANVLEAAREGDQRGVAPTAGRVLASQQAMTDVQRGELEKTIIKHDAAVAEEASRLRDVKTQINLQEAAGAQLAAAREGEMAQMHTAQAVQAGGQVVSGAIQGASLYGSEKAVSGQMDSNATFQADVAKQYDPAGTGGVANMSNLQFRDYMTKNFTNKEIRNMFPTTATPTPTTGNTIASGGVMQDISAPTVVDRKISAGAPIAQETVFWKGQINPQTRAPFRSETEYRIVMGR